MSDEILKTVIFIGVLGMAYLIAYGILIIIERKRREKRNKLKARAERYAAIERLRVQATYHERCLRNKLIAEGRRIIVRGRSVE